MHSKEERNFPKKALRLLTNVVEKQQKEKLLALEMEKLLK